MTVQHARLELAEALRSLAPDWTVTTATYPTVDIFDGTIVVGHPLRIAPQSYSLYIADLLVTLWVSEAESETAVDRLYERISPGPLSLITGIANAPELRGFVNVSQALNVGLRDEGPSGFLAADIEVGLRVGV